jgi:hypothetical protein
MCLNYLRFSISACTEFILQAKGIQAKVLERINSNSNKINLKFINAL